MSKSDDETIPLMDTKSQPTKSDNETLRDQELITTEKPEYLNETKEMIEWYKKWEKSRMRILLLVSFSALLAPGLSTLFLPALNYIIEDLNATQELAALTISIYLGVTGVFPLVWGILVDRLGRKTILLISLGCTIFTSLGCSFAWNIYVLIGARTLQAIGLCASGIVGAASISDVFPKSIRAFALGIWGITVLLGPVLGPLSGGIVSQYLGWRSIFRGAAIYAGINFLLILFFLPDTMKKDENREKRSINILSPLKSLVNLPILVPCVSQGMMFSVMYFTLYLLPIEIAKNFNFNQLQNGLAFLPLGIGLILGSFVGGRFADFMYRKYGSGGRMFSGLVSLYLLCIPINLFAYYIKTNIIVTLVCTFLIGFSLQFGRPGLMSFGIERKPQEAASVSACFIFVSFGVFGFTITTLGPFIIDLIGIRLCYFLFSGMICLASLLQFYIMYLYWGFNK